MEGCIGVGKTSLLEHISHTDFPGTVHYEPVDRWRNWAGINWLERFYTKPAEHTFGFQKVIFDSYDEVLNDATRSCAAVIERSPRAALKIFSSLSMKNNMLNKFQFLDLTEIYNARFRKFENSDCHTIYLRCDPVVIFKRMSVRGRKEEVENLTLEMIQQLCEQHDAEYMNSANVFVIDETAKEISIKDKTQIVYGYLTDLLSLLE